jgi:hypothetical protein
MRSQFFILPAAVVASLAAHAESFLTVEEAQSLVFPGATMTPADFTMNEKQVDQLIKITGSTVYRSKVRVWRASTGGWFFVDQVPGKDDRVTYAVGLDEQGAVIGIEILVCLPAYGRVREPEWLNQFRGKRHADGGLADSIVSISGTTLTSEHIADGVQRVLATYALFMKQKAK